MRIRKKPRFTLKVCGAEPWSTSIGTAGDEVTAPGTEPPGEATGTAANTAAPGTEPPGEGMGRTADAVAVPGAGPPGRGHVWEGATCSSVFALQIAPAGSMAPTCSLILTKASGCTTWVGEGQRGADHRSGRVTGGNTCRAQEKKNEKPQN